MPPTRVATTGMPDAMYSNDARLEPSDPSEVTVPMSHDAITSGKFGNHPSIRNASRGNPSASACAQYLSIRFWLPRPAIRKRVLGQRWCRAAAIFKKYSCPLMR
ncbi:TPA: hypothetical protein DDW35_04670 [Candidatus Sumerlaeota bacterium]|nr:hypothetical protein [Candidatus Sumerlaeota bacterium]